VAERLKTASWRPAVFRAYPSSNMATRFNAKLTPRFIGPLEVRRIVSAVIVDLKDEWEHWHCHVHVQDLKSAPAVEPGGGPDT